MAGATKETIGTVTWPNDGPVATLHVDGSWSVPGREWTEPGLKLALSDAYAGPQDGPFGAAALSELAEMVGGTVKLVPRQRPAEADDDDDDDEIVH